MEGCRCDGNRVEHDPEGVSAASRLKDDERPSLSPVGPVSDGVDCRRSLCTLSGRRRDSSGQYGE